MNRTTYLFFLGLLGVTAALLGRYYFNKNEKVAFDHPRPFPSKEDSIAFRMDSLQHISKPIVGYRFLLVGDFNGDKVQDTIVERYTDSTYTIEQALYDEVMDYEDLLRRAQANNFQSFLEANPSSKIKQLDVGGILGFHYAENCGDINKDGKDEILVVSTNGDWSNLNHTTIYSYTDTNWREIYRMEVWEWMFPLTPSASMLPGMFGNYQFGTTKSDSADAALLKELKDFHYVKWIDSCWIEYECRNDLDSYEDLGLDEEAYHKKFFTKVQIGKEWFYEDNFSKGKYYKLDTEDGFRPDGSEYYMMVDDPASSVIIRINTCQDDFFLKRHF